MSATPDMVPTLAVLAPFASSPTRIRNVKFIRHHESDRIHALAVELARLGVKVVEHEDGLTIQPARPNAAAIETYDDHRIAMSFAIIGLQDAWSAHQGTRLRLQDLSAFFRGPRRTRLKAARPAPGQTSLLPQRRLNMRW